MGVYFISQNGQVSTIQFCFSEPQAINTILSETEGIFKSISPSAPNVYQLHDPSDHH